MSIVVLSLVGTLLCLVQFLAALPWLAALDPEAFRVIVRRPGAWVKAIGGVLIAGLALGVFLLVIQDRERLEFWGRLYAAGLQLQLSADFFTLVFGVLLIVWPRGGAVALAAFREGVRQPLFWMFVGLGAILLFLFLFIPYFTFGEDVKMMKQIDHDLVMLLAVAFGIIAAGLSITEEIEGRTAITLMSKPVSRRQFLLGKYVGILLAALALTAVLAWGFQWTLYFRPFLEPFADIVDPRLADPLYVQIAPGLTAVASAVAPPGEAEGWLLGVALWFADGLSALPGLAVGFGQVMLLVAIACALATRLPMVVTLLACLLLFFLGNLAPVLLQVVQNYQAQFAQEHQGQTSGALELVQFVAQVLDTLLPSLEYFNLGPAIVRDKPLPLGEYAWYVGSLLVYAVLYTTIALLFGLILFEDRDLA